MVRILLDGLHMYMLVCKFNIQWCVPNRLKIYGLRYLCLKVVVLFPYQVLGLPGA